MSSEKELEEEIQNKGLNAPRLIPSFIDSKIKFSSNHDIPIIKKKPFST